MLTGRSDDGCCREQAEREGYDIIGWPMEPDHQGWEPLSEAARAWMKTPSIWTPDVTDHPTKPRPKFPSYASDEISDDLGFPPYIPLKSLQRYVRCRGCGVRGRGMISIRGKEVA